MCIRRRVLATRRSACRLMPVDAASEMIADYVLEQGASRVVLDGPQPMQIHPPLFASAEKAGKGVRFVIEPTGDDAMDQRMLERELPGRIQEVGLLVAATATIAWPGAAADHGPVTKMVEALRGKQVATILLDAGGDQAVQLHPEQSSESVVAAAGDATPAPEVAKSPAPAVPPTPLSPSTVTTRLDTTVAIIVFCAMFI